MAEGGPTNGVMSIDIGISESRNTAPGVSISRGRTITSGVASQGCTLGAFGKWFTDVASPGSVNTLQ
eukprot:scaffold45868_cov191-Amphora_coffeaeformis.AAC.1